MYLEARAFPLSKQESLLLFFFPLNVRSGLGFVAFFFFFFRSLSISYNVMPYLKFVKYFLR